MSAQHSYYVVALLYNNKSETCVGSLSCLVWVRFFPDQDCWPRTPQWVVCISTFLFKIEKTIVTVQFRSQHSTGTAQTELGKNWQNCLSFLHESTLGRKVSDSFGNEKSIPSNYYWVFLGHLGCILNEICCYDNSSFLDLFLCRKLQKLCQQIKTKTVEYFFVTVSCWF